jgi:DNA-binding transcriptional regulator YhcF (GntR family)
MVITIDRLSGEPIYQQIRSQVIQAIATGELEEGTQLPSVRSLAGDLGVNYHTVHEAYGVLRDEGYVVMRGRSGAIVAARDLKQVRTKSDAEDERMAEVLLRLALAHKARGGTREDFLAAVTKQADVAYGLEDPSRTADR